MSVAHLQDEPELIPTLDVLLVVHPVELDHVGVVREGFQDVVLCLDLFIYILEKNRGHECRHPAGVKLRASLQS